MVERRIFFQLVCSISNFFSFPTETLLMDNDCPQEARLAARGKHCMLAYKRIDAKIAWPTMTSN